MYISEQLAEFSQTECIYAPCTEVKKQNISRTVSGSFKRTILIVLMQISWTLRNTAGLLSTETVKTNEPAHAFLRMTRTRERKHCSLGTTEGGMTPGVVKWRRPTKSPTGLLDMKSRAHKLPTPDEGPWWLNGREVHGCQVQAFSLSAAKANKLSEQRQRGPMDVITESPISKTMGVPPLSEPDWMRPSEILFQFQSQFLTHTQILVGYQELLWNVLSHAFNWGLSLWVGLICCLFPPLLPFFRIFWFLMFSLEAMSLNFYKNKEIWWWEEKRRLHSGYLLITHPWIHGGLISAWVFQAVEFSSNI